VELLFSNQKKIIIFKNKKTKLDTISKALNSLNIKNFLSITKFGLRLISYDKKLYSFLSQFGLGRDKHIPREFLNLNKYYIRYLLEAIINSSVSGNAIITKDYKLKSKTTATATTPSETLVNNIHELIIKLGFYFNTSAIYRDPMRRIQYDPLTSGRTPYFETLVSNNIKYEPVTKNRIKTTIYTVSTAPKLKLTLIRNQSKPVWIG
jgi:hypothetical protein